MMRNGHMFVFVAFAIGPLAVTGQTRGKAQQKNSAVRVPFVPCKADGQIGPVDAPDKVEKFVNIDPALARKLAYYESSVAPGLLAPRGWHCFGVYGSSGSAFYVKPEPLDESHPFQAESTGRVIKIDYIEGESSGRVQVAQVIARVFPKHLDFVKRVVDLFEPEIAYSPYPTDKLTYRSDDLVEFVTPPNSRGLGTESFIKPNNESIEGFAMLQGPSPDLLLLVVRLPPEMQAF